MPIRPDQRGRYPKNWPEISHRIRFARAHGRCECTGECGRPGGHLADDGRCRNEHGEPAYGNGKPVVLTTAHRDHTPENNTDDNLAAFCAPCHLFYDRDEHAATRAATSRRSTNASAASIEDASSGPHREDHQ